MRELEEKVKSAIKPASPCGKVFYGAVFFVTGLLLVHYASGRRCWCLPSPCWGSSSALLETLGRPLARWWRQGGAAQEPEGGLHP